MTPEDVNIEMGEYEILCNKEQNKWRLVDRLSGEEHYFRRLADLLDSIEQTILSVEIES